MRSVVLCSVKAGNGLSGRASRQWFGSTRVMRRMGRGTEGGPDRCRPDDGQAAGPVEAGACAYRDRSLAAKGPDASRAVGVGDLLQIPGLSGPCP